MAAADDRVVSREEAFREAAQIHVAAKLRIMAERAAAEAAERAA